jgi:hypothetical protein
MKTTTQKQVMCSICQQPIPPQGSWLLGNNAEPVNSGRCCNDCNTFVVIPARLNRMRRDLAKQGAPE